MWTSIFFIACEAPDHQWCHSTFQETRLLGDRTNIAKLLSFARMCTCLYGTNAHQGTNPR
jgi:hypothetical protein